MPNAKCLSCSLMPVRFSISFTGLVQGVFFRATTRDIARDYAVSGWVRNEIDGSVRCVVEGERDELDRFLAAVRLAKKTYIEDVAIEESNATGEFTGFSIRP